MSNSNDRSGAQSRHSKAMRWGVLGVTVALAYPVTVFCALNALEAKNTKPDARGAESVAKAAANAGHQIRCWQYGRLIFEENYLMAPSESTAYLLNMRGTGADRAPVYLVDTRNATCLIKTGSEPGKVSGK